ncbi:hypothetical protein BDN72DRAFT_847226 [Pluteus cervinus]|uniref:Uncharacterized protein n=1 Tax=Pluteus cervinus TaxID=181527 RepID=A0ACD3AEN4_9AGAR|nr:hypothetical protein BDN72DRAFT_847226 [Pluteus cervinus]
MAETIVDYILPVKEPSEKWARLNKGLFSSVASDPHAKPRPDDPTPMDVLPPEIVKEIFMHCLPSMQQIRLRKDQLPWVLTQVCRVWRDIALSAPELWSFIALTMEDVHKRPNLDKLVRYWLTLKKDYPLTLDFPVTNLRPPNSTRILNLLLIQHDSWRSVRLDLHHENFLQKLIDLRTPNLEVLDLTKDSPSPLIMDVAKSFFRHSPKLREFILASRELEVNSFSELAGLPAWHSLKSVDIRCRLPMTALFDILSAGPGLESLRLIGLRTHPALIAEPIEVVHTSLRSLCLSVEQEVYTAMKLLTLPSLKALVISFSHPFSLGGDPVGDPYLASFFSRSKPPLEKLALENTRISEVEIVESLPHLPTLTRLELINEKFVQFTEAFVDVLAKPGVCPLMNWFTLVGQCSSADGKLAAMMEERWKKREISGLHFVNIRFLAYGENHTEDAEILKRLQAAGLKGYVSV